MRRAQAAARSIEGTLRVGYLTHAHDEAFARLAARFGQRYPACELVTVDITGTHYFEVLRSGRIEVAMGRFGPGLPDDLVAGPVMSSEPHGYWGSPGTDPLAGQEAVSVEELSQYPIFGIPDARTGALHNPLYPATTPTGLALSYRGIARSFIEVLALVAAGENVFPTAESFPLYYGHPDVRFVPMHGWPPARRILVYRQGSDPTTMAFVTLAAEPDPPAALHSGWLGPRTLAIDSPAG